MITLLERALALVVFVPVAACADPPKPAASRRGSFDHGAAAERQARLPRRRSFTAVMIEHRCVQPGRITLPTAATRRKPSPDATPNYAAGYSVTFGPDPSTLEQGGSTVPMGGTVPGLPPLENPIVNYFSLQIEPLPDQLAASGPVRLSRSFSIGMTARGAWEGRFVEGDAKTTSGSVTLDPDGLGGRFRLTGVEPHLVHGRMAPSGYVTVSGSWRCPSS